jgi:hypothetical protein
MKLTLPVWNLLVASFTVASVWANASLESPDKLSDVDPSSSLRYLSGGTSCTGRVTGWELIDTKTYEVKAIKSGDIVYSNNPSFSIRALVTGSGTRSVPMTLNTGYTNTENVAPYALCTNLGDTYRRCKRLTHGKHTVTGAACCDRDGRGTCQRPPTTLVFEIRRPAPTKPPTKAPTKAPMKVCAVPGNAGCCGAGVIAADTYGNCCTPNEIVAYNPRGPVFDNCCPRGTMVASSAGECCPPGNIVMNVTNYAELVYYTDVCCPSGTKLVGTTLGQHLECCKPGDVLVPSPLLDPALGFVFCCPNRTIAATINPTNFSTVCCPPNTGVNRVTKKCCADGQRECTPKPSPSCAVVGNDGDGDECCGAGVLAADSEFTCCAPGLIRIAFSNRTGFDICCPQGSTGVDHKCCPTGNVLVTSKVTFDIVEFVRDFCCPAGTTVAGYGREGSGQGCCELGDILVSEHCCPNSTIAVGRKADFSSVCCPPDTGVNPVTEKCCADGQKECKPSPSCAVVGNDEDDEDGDDCCGTNVTAADWSLKCCKPGEIIAFDNPAGNRTRLGFCCPQGSTGFARDAGCCLAGTVAVKQQKDDAFAPEICCPAGATLLDTKLKCCKPSDILSPFLEPSSIAVYCCSKGTSVSAYNTDFSIACCPTNTGANLKTNQCCPAGQTKC